MHRRSMRCSDWASAARATGSHSRHQACRLLQVAHVSVPIRGSAVRLDHPDLDKFFRVVPRKLLRPAVPVRPGQGRRGRVLWPVTCVDPRATPAA